MADDNDIHTLHPAQLGGDMEYGDQNQDRGLEADDAGGQQHGDDISQHLQRLEQQIKQQNERFENQQRFMNTALQNMMYSQPGAQQQQAQEAQKAGLDFDDLPDPVDKPEEFRKALANKMSSFQEQESARLRSEFQQQSQTGSQADDLWRRFQSEYPELAKREALVQGATALEMQALSREGVPDPQRAVFMDPDGFIKRVASRMERELGAEGGDEGNADSAAGGGARQQSNRTQGVSSGTRQAAAAPPANKPPGFLSQLKKTQLDSGLI